MAFYHAGGDICRAMLHEIVDNLHLSFNAIMQYHSQRILAAESAEIQAAEIHDCLNAGANAIQQILNTAILRLCQNDNFKRQTALDLFTIHCDTPRFPVPTSVFRARPL